MIPLCILVEAKRETFALYGFGLPTENYFPSKGFPRFSPPPLNKFLIIAQTEMSFPVILTLILIRRLNWVTLVNAALLGEEIIRFSCRRKLVYFSVLRLRILREAIMEK